MFERIYFNYMLLIFCFIIGLFIVYLYRCLYRRYIDGIFCTIAYQILYTLLLVIIQLSTQTNSKQAKLMSSNIKIDRICEHCGKTFTAQTTVTRYCYHRCNSQTYKARKRAGKREQSDDKLSKGVARSC